MVINVAMYLKKKKNVFTAFKIKRYVWIDPILGVTKVSQEGSREKGIIHKMKGIMEVVFLVEVMG
jgi:hypothetical protein